MTSVRDEIPAHLAQFIHSCLDSVEQLQVLLLLFEHPQEAWTIDSLSRELRSSPASVHKRVRDLQTRRVLAENTLNPGTGAVHFHATSPSVEQTTRELCELFRQRPHRVIAQIFAKPPASLQSFADAFMIKKEDKE